MTEQPRGPSSRSEPLHPADARADAERLARAIRQKYHNLEVQIENIGAGRYGVMVTHEIEETVRRTVRVPIESMEALAAWLQGQQHAKTSVVSTRVAAPPEMRHEADLAEDRAERARERGQTHDDDRPIKATEHREYHTDEAAGPSHRERSTVEYQDHLAARDDPYPSGSAGASRKDADEQPEQGKKARPQRGGNSSKGTEKPS